MQVIYYDKRLREEVMKNFEQKLAKLMEHFVGEPILIIPYNTEDDDTSGETVLFESFMKAIVLGQTVNPWQSVDFIVMIDGKDVHSFNRFNAVWKRVENLINSGLWICTLIIPHTDKPFVKKLVYSYDKKNEKFIPHAQYDLNFLS